MGTQLPSPKRERSPPQFSSHAYCGQTAGWIKMTLGMEVGLGLGHTVPSSPPQKGAEPPISGPFLLWSDGCMYQDTTWYGSRPQPWRHCVRWGPSSPPLNGQSSPNFRSMSVVAKRMTGWTKMPLGMDVGLGPGDFVFGGDPASPPRKEGTAPIQFLAPLSHVYSGQTAGWIKTPLGTEVIKPRPRRRCIRWGRSSP